MQLRTGVFLILAAAAVCLPCKASCAADYLKNDAGFYQPVISLEQANRRMQTEPKSSSRGFGILISEAGDNIGRKTFLEKPELHSLPEAAKVSTPS